MESVADIIYMVIMNIYTEATMREECNPQEGGNADQI
jgi:hypothetical protein